DRLARAEPAHLGDLALIGDGFLTLRHRGGVEARVEPERLDLRRDPVREVHERVRGQTEALGAQHVPERSVIDLTRAAVAGVALAVEPHGGAVGPVRQEEPHLLERLADDAYPVTERGRRRNHAKPARGLRRVELAAPGNAVVGAVAGLDLAPGKHEVAGGELARRVP